MFGKNKKNDNKIKYGNYTFKNRTYSLYVFHCSIVFD